MDECAVVNASPLILLSRVGEVDLLQGVARSFTVPESVVQELLAKGPEDAAVQALKARPWLQVEPRTGIPPQIAEWNLGAGESAVLTTALGRPGCVAVLDDSAARRCAESRRIHVVGTVGGVLLAKRRGRIPLARPVLEKLVAGGMFFSPRTLDEALRRFHARLGRHIGESPDPGVPG